MITFRAIETEDLSLLKKWRNSEFVRPYTREYRFLNDGDQHKWFASYLEARRKSDFDQEILIIQILDKEQLIPMGVGGFTRIQWRNRRAELTFYLADQSHLERIMEVLNALIIKGFDEFGFHKITWPVYGHDPKLNIYRDIFTTEAILKEEYFWNGRFQDRYYLSLINKNA